MPGASALLLPLAARILNPVTAPGERCELLRALSAHDGWIGSGLRGQRRINRAAIRVLRGDYLLVTATRVAAHLEKTLVVLARDAAILQRIDGAQPLLNPCFHRAQVFGAHDDGSQTQCGQDE